MAAKNTDEEVVPRLGRVLDFMRMLWALDHGLQSTSKRMEATLGVTGPQRLVIRIVGQLPGISAGQVATILHLHPSTLTGILKRLQRNGVLLRKTDPSDARRAQLYLTPRGEHLNRSRAGTVEAAVNRVLATLPQDKVDAACEVLTRLAVQVSRTSA